MSTLYVFVIIVTFSTNCSAYVLSHSETDRSIASVILKEGQSTEISCMTKGTGDFFWWKGETLYNSTLVASFTLGEVSDDSQPYSVTVNGTLHIKSVTLKDEGNYFCRLSSTENECYGEVKILVQASLFNFDLAIDRCDRQSSCLLYLDPSQSTSMTCIALNAPPLMTLKWFNGSKEITEGIVQNEILSQNGNSREITSTVAAVYGHPASLTCQAVDPKRSNDDVRFAHAQVEMTVPFIETLPSWIIVSVTLAGCFIVFGIFLLIKAMINREQRKKYTKVKKEDDESLKGELKKSRNDNIELQTKVAKDEANIKSAETLAHKQTNEITELKDLLKQQKVEIKQERNENVKLQKTIASAKGETIVAEELVERRNEEITKLKETVEQKDKEINNEREKFLDCQTNLQREQIASQGKSDDISKLKDDLTEKDDEIVKISKELDKLKTNLQKEKIALQGKSDDIDKLKGNSKEKDIELEKIKKELDKLKDDLRQREEEIKKERNANVKLQNTIANANGKITVAEELAQRGDKEITELKEKVEQKDKEIKHQRDKFIECQTNLQRKETDIKRKDDKMFELEGNLTAKDNELAKIEKELDKLKEELTQKDHKLQDLYKESRNAERGSHRRQGKNEKGN